MAENVSNFYRILRARKPKKTFANAYTKTNYRRKKSISIRNEAWWCSSSIDSRCCFYNCMKLKDFSRLLQNTHLCPCSLSWNMHTLFLFLIPLPVPIQSQNRSFFVVLRPEAQDKKYDKISIMCFTEWLLTLTSTNYLICKLEGKLFMKRLF